MTERESMIYRAVSPKIMKLLPHNHNIIMHCIEYILYIGEGIPPGPNHIKLNHTKNIIEYLIFFVYNIL